jgi:hypothetical protein
MVARLLDENGTLTYKGLRLRYVRFFADGGEEWAALRGFPLDLPSLENLGMQPNFVRALRGWGTKRGLIIVGGKTTTCVSAIKDYLERLGGFAYTMEDLHEYQMQGPSPRRASAYRSRSRTTRTGARPSRGPCAAARTTCSSARSARRRPPSTS